MAEKSRNNDNLGAFKPEPMPKGVNDYRQQMWYAQQWTQHHMAELNGSVKNHGLRLDKLEDGVKQAKMLGKGLGVALMAFPFLAFILSSINSGDSNLLMRLIDYFIN